MSQETPADRAAWLTEHACSLLGQDVTSCLFINSWRMDFSSVTALLFRRGDRRPSLIAKIGRGDGHELLVEHRNLNLLARSESASFRASVPQVRDFGSDGDACFLFQTVVAGEPVHQPSTPPAGDALADALADWMLDFHRVTDVVHSPATTAEQERALLAPLESFRRRFDVAPTERQLLDDVERALTELVGSSLPLVLLHDDFSPSNVLLDDGRLGVIDWGSTLERAPPLFDLIHLFPCLAADAGERDGLRVFERCFLEPSALARTARRSIHRYMDGLGLSLDAIRPLFTLYWLVYALQKLDNIEAIANSNSGAASGANAVWGLAVIKDRTLMNLSLLARKSARLQLS